jgi:hypothetical protein
MTQYFVVLSIWDESAGGPGTFNEVVFNKVRQMINEGKMVKGTLRNQFPSFDHVPVGYMVSDPFHPEPHFFTETDIANKDLGALFTNRIFRTDNDAKIVYITMPTGEWKGVRVLKTQADADEWIAFCYSLGAINSRIMTEQEIAELAVTWPADSVIANYFVNTSA